VGWVTSIVLAVALVAVAVVLGRRVARLRAQLAAAGGRAVAVPDGADTAHTADADTAKAAANAADSSDADHSADAADPANADNSADSADHLPDPGPDPPSTVPVPTNPTGSEDHEDRRLPSLWALTLLEQERQWRLGQAAGSDVESGGRPDQLDGVLAVEVERIREEIGTPGSLDARVSPPVSAGDAALIFHATRQLLGLLVPYTQAFDLSVGRTGDEVVLELTCSGWEGTASLADGVGRLLEAVAPAGGDIELDLLDDERLQAVLRLPTELGSP
jgi:hypothetical protein